jgi:hypothetical protein
MQKLITTAAAASLIAAALASAAPVFAAQTGSGIGSVVNCDATGSRQGKGAAIGAVVGAVIGNNVSHSKNAPLVGALTGAAAGSYIGCQQQRQQEAARGTGHFVATTNVNIRARPSTSAMRVGQLSRGQAVKVGSYTGNWAWVQPYNGPAGYVSASYLARQ